MEKKTFYSELAYAFGLTLLAFGTALTAEADFGVSMVVAPAYLLHLFVSRFWPAFSFGMAEYVFQALLLAVLSASLRRFGLRYVFSFLTAVIYAFILDLAMYVLSFFPAARFIWRLVYYAVGLLLCAAGVAMLFNTYLPPEAYELAVKEISAKYGFALFKVKTVYDCCSCLLAVILSFAFFGFGRFVGINAGTAVAAVINGPLIGAIDRAFKKIFSFKDALPARRFFE